MRKMINRQVFISLLLLLLVSIPAYSRSIRGDLNLVSDGVDPDQSKPPFLEWKLSAAAETCEPTYGFLPCSTNVWGLLFLIVVYEIVLSLGGRYVGIGSNLFLQITGPGIFGASLFQVLGTFPQVILVLVSTLSGSTEAAQQRVTMGMGLVTGTTVMLLTLIWGSSVVLGSYDLSEATTTDQSETQKNTPNGYGIVTDAETSYTARIMLLTLIPFLIILLAKFFNSSPGRRVVILLALIVTVILLISYVLYEIFQPWIQNRRFEHLMTKYAKDKLLTLLSKNGRPDTEKIQELFNTLDKDNNASVSATEFRVWLLGVKMDEDNLGLERDIEDIMESFDTSGDRRIGQDEFIRGMTQLVSDLSNQTPGRVRWGGGSNSQNNSELRQGLLADTDRTRRAVNSVLNFFRAMFFVIVGTVILCAFAQPLTNSVVGFSQTANISSFLISYLAIPFATNYGTAVQSVTSARQRTQRSISLTLSSLYGGVYMNNIVGLIVYLAPVYAKNLSADVFAEVLVVLAICIVMTLLASFRTTFSRRMGYLVLLLHPISLAVLYLLTTVLGLP